MGLAPGTLSKAGAASGSSAVTHFDPSGGASSSVCCSMLPLLRVLTEVHAPQLVPSSLQQQLAAENLYRDANTLLYADSKPSEEAIDKVISKINKEYVYPFRFCCMSSQPLAASTRRRSSRASGRTRTRATSPTSTSAIVSSTRRFVRRRTQRNCFSWPLQIARYYDKYTAEIRASFERGTAL